MENKSTTTQSANANDYLSHHCNGANSIHKYMMGIAIKSGAKELAEKNRCYWLLDIICSHQFSKKVKIEEFQVWKLIKNSKGDGCKVVCEDGNDNVVVTQKIPFTDFPYKTATLWLVNNLIMLPSEY
jgi:hypothetical protein